MASYRLPMSNTNEDDESDNIYHWYDRHPDVDAQYSFICLIILAK